MKFLPINFGDVWYQIHRIWDTFTFPTKIYNILKWSVCTLHEGIIQAALPYNRLLSLLNSMSPSNSMSKKEWVNSHMLSSVIRQDVNFPLSINSVHHFIYCISVLSQMMLDLTCPPAWSICFFWWRYFYVIFWLNQLSTWKWLSEGEFKIYWNVFLTVLCLFWPCDRI